MAAAATSTIAQPYQIALVNNDLTTDETLLDVFHSLDHLSAIVNEIFTKIDTRIDAEKTRISYIKSRVDVCQQKVKQIKGTSQAITIFSTAKYPAPKELPLYPTLLQESSITHPMFRDVGDDVVYLPAEAASSLINHADLQSEVVTIYSRLNSHGRELERVEFTMEDEGLGPIPVHVASIASVLLFNSSVNVYKNYQTLDNLEFTGREKTMKDEASKQLASAPATLVSGDALPDIQGLDLTFKPTMGEMSSLALPENLPLDFLANNIQFTGVDLPSIAPSAYGKANYSLPQLTDGGYSSGPTAKQSSAPVSSSTVSGPPPPPPPTGGATASASAPPPPPPPSSSGPPPPPPAAAAASAPPPPPPMSDAGAPPMPPAAAAMAAAPPSDGGAGAGAGEGEGDSNLPKPDARRASLLDSIKGMGMAKLKKRDESAEAERRPARKEPPKAMSMQDALRERLARRNDAISGKSDRDSKHRDSVIIREAAKKGPTAPPPVAPAPSSAPKKGGLASLGFASVEDQRDSDNESTVLPKMPARMPPPRANNSDSDSDSDMSIDSRKPTPSTAPVIPPPMAKIAAPIQQQQTTTAPPPLSKPAAAPPADDQAVFASLLARASTIGKKKAANDSDSDADNDEDDEDWD